MQPTVHIHKDTQELRGKSPSQPFTASLSTCLLSLDLFSLHRHSLGSNCVYLRQFGLQLHIFATVSVIRSRARLVF